mgnify:FL=1
MTVAVAAFSAFSAHLYFGSLLIAQAETAIDQNLVLVDHYANGQHELSGIAMVPTDCHEIAVRVEESSGRTVSLLFEVWQQSPKSLCEDRHAPRAVRSIVQAPEDIEFRALVNDIPVSLRVVRQ